MRYAKSLPEGRFFGWDEAKALGKTHYLLMHSLIYRTSLLRECGMKLPEHTFYVDNLVAFIPLPYVKRCIISMSISTATLSEEPTSRLTRKS